jgi:type 1 fimbria pilin
LRFRVFCFGEKNLINMDQSMNKSFSSLFPLAAVVLALGATQAQASDGVINFTGEIVAASCTIGAGGGTSAGGDPGNQIIEVDLGKVSADSLGGIAGGGVVAGTPINLEVDCGNTATGLTSVDMRFDPYSGSGLDPRNNQLLKTTGTAVGVGIGLYKSDNTLLNLGANEFITAELTTTGVAPDTVSTASLNLRAGYVANGDPVDAGTALGTLPFTLTYN